jgi:hypothetical protein
MLESTRLALYFRAQLVVRTVQPNMINVGFAAPHRKRNALHRFAPQRNASQCDAAQGNVGRLEQSSRPSFAPVLTVSHGFEEAA